MKALRYTRQLIEMESTSNLSNRLISKYLERKLTKYGFVVEKVEYRDENRVRKVNLIAKKGAGSGGIAYFAHNDTVPAEKWHSTKFGPFQPAISKDRLYGRGSCDMKGSIACMLTASQLFEADKMRQPLYFIITADEEVGNVGARHVVEESKYYREIVAGGTPAIIGEPTMLDVVNAHKGSDGFRVVSTGRAAHSSTREGKNANLAMIPFLEFAKRIYDETETMPQWQDNRFDPPTMCANIGINDHTAAINMTPAQSICTFFIRPLPKKPVHDLIRKAEVEAERHGLFFERFRHNDPFFTDPELPFVKKSLELAHRSQAKTVSYGTDGGVFTEIESKVVLGPGNIAQAHTADEWIALEQLSLGTELYARFVRHYCG